MRSKVGLRSKNKKLTNQSTILLTFDYLHSIDQFLTFTASSTTVTAHCRPRNTEQTHK